MFQTILCPIDGSEHADKALDLAIDLAGKYGAGVHLLHVLLRDLTGDELLRFAETEGIAEAVPSEQERLMQMPPGQMVPGGTATPPQAVASGVVAAIGEKILDAARRKATVTGVEVAGASIENGDPARRILESAERNGVDLIVMGTRGLSDLKGLFLGSVSHKVANSAACTCITVK